MKIYEILRGCTRSRVSYITAMVLARGIQVSIAVHSGGLGGNGIAPVSTTPYHFWEKRIELSGACLLNSPYGQAAIA